MHLLQNFIIFFQFKSTIKIKKKVPKKKERKEKEMPQTNQQFLSWPRIYSPWQTCPFE